MSASYVSLVTLAACVSITLCSLPAPLAVKSGRSTAYRASQPVQNSLLEYEYYSKVSFFFFLGREAKKKGHATATSLDIYIYIYI